jgi:hypothetical protein
MDLWLTSEGNLAKNASEELLKCDDCPCSSCDVATTSYVVTGSDFSSTVTKTSTWPWTCDTGPAGPCIWVGVITTGIDIGKTLALHGFKPSNWFVSWKFLDCTSSFGAVDLGQVEPPGSYTNSITVT